MRPCCAAPPAGGDPERGRLLLRQFGCGTCHRIPGVAAARGGVGPPLDGVARRVYLAGSCRTRRTTWRAGSARPQGVDPRTAMPDMQVGEAHARDMAAYLYQYPAIKALVATAARRRPAAARRPVCGVVRHLGDRTTPGALYGCSTSPCAARCSRRAAAIVVPPLEDPAGSCAGSCISSEHCVQCHGAPGVAPEPFALGLMPAPASLAHTAREWQPAELFWVIKYGIKMTGMPAWAFRLSDDDSWAVVAFLRISRGFPRGDRARAAPALEREEEAGPEAGSAPRRDRDPSIRVRNLPPHPGRRRR